MLETLSFVTLLAQESKDAVPGDSTSGWIVFLVVVAVFVVPFLVGGLIAKAMRLPDLGFKMGVVLFAVVAALCPFAYRIAEGQEDLSVFERAKSVIPLGIDLAGGTNLVYQVDRQAAAELEKEIDARLMDQMVSAIARRINPSGTEEVTVRRVGVDRIEVIIPGADQSVVEEKKRAMTRLGSLEFEILANMRDHRAIIQEAQRLPDDVDAYTRGSQVVAAWKEIAGEDFHTGGDIVTREVPRTEDDGTERQVRQVLVMVTPERQRVTGRYLLNASPTMDEDGSPAVGFTFGTQGAYRFQTLTSNNLPDQQDQFRRRLAILLDDKVHSAPSIEKPIGANGIIHGSFTQQEIQSLVDVLNAGALEVPLEKEPITEATISPLLGIDVQQKGVTAIVVSALAVFLFMAVYYLVAGLIANMCLMLNLVLILGAMVLIQATFTLPGLAGLVLTIGMAVDANVLIFERIREENRRGASLRMAIQNGFDKAFSAIIDGNITTLIVAIVLYLIGTDQVRGFAVTLFIGIVASLFTALYFGRMVFEILERKRLIKSVKMLTFVGETHWQFINKKYICFALSALVIFGGLASLAARGKDNLDIDFSGGTMVSFEFVEPQEVDDVRSVLEGTLGSSISLEQLTLTDEEGNVEEVGRRYRLRTTETDVAAVRDSVAQAFADSEHELRKASMDFAPLTPITEADADAAEASAEETSETEVPSVSNPFAGGHETILTLSDPETVSNMGAELSAALQAVNSEYQQPATLFEMVGLGDPVVEGDARKFADLKLRARSGLSTEDLQAALVKIQRDLASSPQFAEVNSFDSAVALEMRFDAIVAMLMSMAAIVAYLWFRFQRVTFGLACIAAIVHDILFVLGMVPLASYLSGTPIGSALLLSDFKINLPMIAAFMTIIGYSLNDTIVVFDRVREVRGKNPAITEAMVDLSLNQTLARTILTSLTTLIVVGILYVFGGEGIHGFAFCMVVGVMIGTYSTIYIAAPALVWLMNRGTNVPGQAAGRAA